MNKILMKISLKHVKDAYGKTIFNCKHVRLLYVWSDPFHRQAAPWRYLVHNSIRSA